MSKKQRKFADDGWAVWIDGEDTSTIHINDWLNPKGNSYVDIAIHIRGIRVSKLLNVYVPFSVVKEEIEDVSLSFSDTKILQAIFSAACIVDYKKNPYASEIAYNGKTIDMVDFYILFNQDSIDDSRIGGYVEQGLTKEIGSITVHYSLIEDGAMHGHAKFLYEGNLYVIDVKSSGSVHALDTYLNMVLN